MNAFTRTFAAILVSVSLTAADTVRAEELDMGKFHLLIHQNEVQAMARFAANREAASVKVEVFDLGTERGANGQPFAVAMAKFSHTPGGLQWITPTFLTTHLYCVTSLDEAAKLKRGEVTTFTGNLFDVQTEDQRKGKMRNGKFDTWDQIKHV